MEKVTFITDKMHQNKHETNEVAQMKHPESFAFIEYVLLITKVDDVLQYLNQILLINAVTLTSLHD